MQNLADKDLHNGALVALDYQTGELVAYVGSARLLRDARADRSSSRSTTSSARAIRQPGSAFKPFNYAVGIDDERVHGRARCSWTSPPTSAAATPRATPTTSSAARSGSATPCSSRSTSRRSRRWPSTTPDHVVRPGPGLRDAVPDRDDGRRAGARPGRRGGPARRPRHRLRHARQRRRRVAHTTILTIKDRAGDDVVEPYVAARAASRSSARRRPTSSPTSSPRTPTRRVNPFWGDSQSDDAGRRRRPGDAQDRHEQRRQGPQRLRLHRAADARQAATAGAYALAVGVWNGNSDNTPVSTADEPLFSIDVSTYVWQGFLNEASRRPGRSTDFAAAATASSRSRSTRGPALSPTAGDDAVDEWFIAGTQPDAAARRGHVRRARSCERDRASRTGFEGWLTADRDWIAPRRARPGHGRRARRNPDRVLLQQQLQAVRPVVGRRSSAAPAAASRARRRPASRPDARRERRRSRRSRIPSPSGSDGGAAALPDRRRRADARPSSRPSARARPRSRRPSRRRNRRPSRPRNRRPSRRPSRRRRRRRRPSRAVRRALATRARSGRADRPSSRCAASPSGAPGGRSWVRSTGRPRRRALGRAGPQRLGQDHPRCRSSASMHLWPTTRHGRRPRRALRPDRRARAVGVGSASAGSAVEGSLRHDLTPHVLIMTARHGATEPWWHVYDDADHDRAPRARSTGLGLGGARRPAVRDPVGRRAPADVHRPGAHARSRPAPPRRAGGQPGPRRARSAARRPRPAGRADRARRRSSCVTHHLEEIPPGFGHALVLADGRGRGGGPDRATCSATTCSRRVRAAARRSSSRDGRWSADAPVTDPHGADTRMSHRRPHDALMTDPDHARRPCPHAGRTSRGPRRGRAPGAAAALAPRRLRAAGRAAARRDVARRRDRPAGHRPPAARRQGLRRRPVRDQRQARPRGRSSSSSRCVIGAGLGLVARRVVRRSRWPASWPSASLGFLASLGDPLANPTMVAVQRRPSRSGSGCGSSAGSSIRGRSRGRRRRGSATVAATHARPVAPRRSCSAAGAIGVGALVAGARRSRACSSATDGARLRARDRRSRRRRRPCRPLAPEADLAPTIAGLTPIVMPNDHFYRIDTALLIPSVDADDWTLRIHGLVDRETTLTCASSSACRCSSST